MLWDQQRPRQVLTCGVSMLIAAHRFILSTPSSDWSDSPHLGPKRRLLIGRQINSGSDAADAGNFPVVEQTIDFLGNSWGWASKIYEQNN